MSIMTSPASFAILKTASSNRGARSVGLMFRDPPTAHWACPESWCPPFDCRSCRGRSTRIGALRRVLKPTGCALGFGCQPELASAVAVHRETFSVREQRTSNFAQGSVIPDTRKTNSAAQAPDPRDAPARIKSAMRRADVCRRG